MNINKYNILSALKSHLVSKYGAEIKDVVLFGSFAKGLQKADSDFDVLIVLRNSFDWNMKDQIREICFDVSLEYDIHIDSKIISESDTEHKFWGKHPLFVDALEYGIHA